MKIRGLLLLQAIGAAIIEKMFDIYQGIVGSKKCTAVENACGFE